jgi:hypothetical protein
MGQTKQESKLLWANLSVKRAFGRERRKEDSLREICSEDRGWIKLDDDRVQNRDFV